MAWCNVRPDLAKEGFSFSLLQDDRTMEERMNDLVFNGDLVAQEALLERSGVCTLLILGTVHFWKREQTALPRACNCPPGSSCCIWLGVFILLGLVIEGIGTLQPAFQTDFMEKVIGKHHQHVCCSTGRGSDGAGLRGVPAARIALRLDPAHDG